MSIAEDHDAELSQIGFIFILVSGLMALIIAVAVYTRWDSTKKREKEDDPLAPDDDESDDDQEGQPKKNQDKNVFRKVKDTKKAKDCFSHHFLLTSLKGHVRNVMDVDFSPDGKYLVSASEDRKLLLWKTKNFSTNDHNPSVSHVDLDTPTRIAFSSGSGSVIVALKGENKLAAYNMKKIENSVKLVPAEATSFASKHTLAISHIGIACTSNYIISASSDNKLIVYGVRGEVYASIEPKLSTLHHAAISPDGKFVGVSGFTPDVFVHSVTFTGDGSFKGIKKAFHLKGHNSGVFAFAFNQDTRRAVSVSKDGTWKLFNTEIRYELGEEAKVIAEGEWEILKSCDPSAVNVAMSPSGKSFVISANTHILLVSTLALEKTVSPVLEIHKAPISSVRISPCGRYIATCGDRFIRIFHNVTEYYSNVVELEQTLKEANNDAAKQRIEGNLQIAKTELKEIIKKGKM